MSRQIVVAPLAQRQIDIVLRESRLSFGGEAAGRYALLIAVALNMLATHPRSPLTKRLSMGSTSIHLFHLRHAKTRVPASSTVGSPRHVLAYRFDEATLEVAQLLHDRMDLQSAVR